MRIRTINPSIHSDESLWDLEQESGLPIFRAFVGLWSAADREGRFEWRPRALKAAILPYWDGDFSCVLDALVTRGFLVQYTSQGRDVGLIRTFKRHQIINNRETASVLPPPPKPANSASQERDPVIDAQTEQSIRLGFQQRYEAAVQSIPGQAQLSKASSALAGWVAETCRLRKARPDDVIPRLLDGFFADSLARSKGFPPAFLAANPIQYFEPRPVNGKPEPTELEKLQAQWSDLSARKRECLFDEDAKKAKLTARMDAVAQQIQTLKEGQNGR